MEKISVVNECEKKTFSRKYALPKVTCAFSVKRSIFHDIPENEEWIKWLFPFSGMKYEAFTKIMGTGQYAQRFYPLCTDIQRYELLYKYVVHLFVIDDHAECEHGDMAREVEQSLIIWKQFGEIFDKLEGNDSVQMFKWKTYIFAMYACLEPMYRSFNDIQKKRFVYEWRLYIEGNIEETQFIGEGRKHESVDELIKVRNKSAACRVVFQIVEYADQLFVPANIWNDSRMQKILELGSLHITNINDIFSFEKEFNETKDLNKTFNMVALISVTKGIPIEEAMKSVAKMNLEVEKEIQELEDQLVNDLPIAKAFIERINLCLGGSYICNSFIDRYNKV